jgi:hypothetical protein
MISPQSAELHDDLGLLRLKGDAAGAEAFPARDRIDAGIRARSSNPLCC